MRLTYNLTFRIGDKCIFMTLRGREDDHGVARAARFIRKLKEYAIDTY